MQKRSLIPLLIAMIIPIAAFAPAKMFQFGYIGFVDVFSSILSFGVFTFFVLFGFVFIFLVGLGIGGILSWFLDYFDYVIFYQFFPKVTSYMRK